MKTSVVVVPVLVAIGGLVTFLVIPLDLRLRLLILGGDLFAAMVIFLVLLRNNAK
jgi:hypothetical protein